MEKPSSFCGPIIPYPVIKSWLNIRLYHLQFTGNMPPPGHPTSTQGVGSYPSRAASDHMKGLLCSMAALNREGSGEQRLVWGLASLCFASSLGGCPGTDPSIPLTDISGCLTQAGPSLSTGDRAEIKPRPSSPGGGGGGGGAYLPVGKRDNQQDLQQNSMYQISTSGVNKYPGEDRVG